MERNILDDQIEGRVLGTLDIITGPSIKLTKKNTQACHRLKKDKYEVNPKIIIRMENRQDVTNVLINKEKLSDKKDEFEELFINRLFENLKRKYHEILDEAKKLKKKKLFQSRMIRRNDFFFGRKPHKST